MHSFESGGITFHYNSDYSGDIRIQFDQTTIKTDLHELILTVKTDAGTERYFLTEQNNGASVPLDAIRHFVASAALSIGVSRLERLEVDEILKHPYLNSVLKDMSKI